jgi:hypothetical protein
LTAKGVSNYFDRAPIESTMCKVPTSEARPSEADLAIFRLCMEIGKRIPILPTELGRSGKLTGIYSLSGVTFVATVVSGPVIDPVVFERVHSQL